MIVDVQELSVFSNMGFTADEEGLLDTCRTPFYRGWASLADETTQETRDGVLGSSRPLKIHGTRFHLNLGKAVHKSLLDSARIVATAMLLGRTRVIELAVMASAATVQNMILEINSLRGEQRELVEVILSLKKRFGVPNRWPTTLEIAEATGQSEIETRRTLQGIKDSIISHDPKEDDWKLRW